MQIVGGGDDGAELSAVDKGPQPFQHAIGEQIHFINDSVTTRYTVHHLGIPIAQQRFEIVKAVGTGIDGSADS